MESPATVVVRGPVPFMMYSQILNGFTIRRAKLNVIGLLIKKGPSSVVTWSCRFSPTSGLSTIGSIWKKNRQTVKLGSYVYVSSAVAWSSEILNGRQLTYFVMIVLVQFPSKCTCVSCIIFHWPRYAASDEGLCTRTRLPMTWLCCLLCQLTHQDQNIHATTPDVTRCPDFTFDFNSYWKLSLPLQ